MFQFLSLLYFFKLIALGALPSGAHAPELAADCAQAQDAALCEASRTSFRNDLRQAQDGDAAAQRNVALCLRNGCDGAVQEDPVLGCAWRIVILASGPTPVNRSDLQAFEQECGAMSLARRLAAEGQARVLASPRARGIAP
jgi:hypothetical protein